MVGQAASCGYGLSGWWRGEPLATTVIEVRGQPVVTLAELLLPGLRAVIVGLNPSQVSVDAEHYFQGRLGKRLWQRLQRAGILHDLPVGREDDEASRQGVGFCDVVRVPSARASHLTRAILRGAAPDLLERLMAAGVRPPTAVLFVYKTAHDAVGPLLREHGFRVFRMPGMYARSDEVERELKRVGEELVRSAAAALDGARGLSADMHRR